MKEGESPTAEHAEMEGGGIGCGCVVAIAPANSPSMPHGHTQSRNNFLDPGGERKGGGNFWWNDQSSIKEEIERPRRSEDGERFAKRAGCDQGDCGVEAKD